MKNFFEKIRKKINENPQLIVALFFVFFTMLCYGIGIAQKIMGYP